MNEVSCRVFDVLEGGLKAKGLSLAQMAVASHSVSFLLRPSRCCSSPAIRRSVSSDATSRVS